MDKKQFTYMMSADYCRNWTAVQAIREVIANALDASKHMKVSWEDGMGKVVDHGTGITAQALVIGQSTKGNDQIGQFGEGLKVAALVLARNNRRFGIRSNGSQYEFKMVKDDTLGMNTLNVVVANGLPHVDGAIVKFDCTEDELAEACSLFLYFNPVPEYDKIILDAPGKIYVMSLLTQDKAGTMFGYNFTAKDVMNRDRTVIDRMAMQRYIGSALANTTNRTVIHKYLDTAVSGHRFMEHDCGFTPRKQLQALWRKVVKELYGDYVCYSTGEADGRAKYLGYTVLKVPYSVSDLLFAIGIKGADRVAPKKREFKFVQTASLEVEERRNLNKAKRLAKKIATRTGWKVLVTEGMDCDGVCKSHQIRIERRILTDQKETIATVLHELAHYEGGPDVSARFEATLTDYCGRLGRLLR